MEAGWVVTEVGRQPWVVRGHLKVDDAATTNEGVWVTFLAIVALYAVVAVTLVLVLRGMSRRFRAQDEAGGDDDDTDAPYGPRGPGGAGGTLMDDVVAVILFVAVTAYAVFGGADFGAGFWDLVAGGAQRGARPRASSSTPSARCGRPTTSG